MQLIDTHSHLDLASFAEDFAAVLARSRKAGIVAQVLPGVCRRHWEHLLQVCRREPDLYAAPGLHPLYLCQHSASHLQELEEIVGSEKVVAVGEIGLDFYTKRNDHNRQYELFERQLIIASKYRLPLLLHVRKAHDQVQAVIRRKRFGGGGIVHAFSGSLQQAEKYIELGFKIAFGGTITYDRATKIRRVASSLPLNAIVLETDAPDIPPAPYHGQRNSPEYLPLVLDALDSLRPESKKELACQTTANAAALLNISVAPPEQV